MSMNRRDFMKIAATGSLGLAGGAFSSALAGAASEGAAAKKPNIIFIFSDQQRPDTLGCYGQKLPISPNLDRLASEGVRFEHAFTCQPVCGPARAALQTGKWATQTRVVRNNIPLRREEKTMAHYLSGAGYEVGYVGKWHLASGGDNGNYRELPVPPELRGGYKDFWIASDVLEFTSHGYDGHMFDAEGKTREFPEGRYRVDATTDFALEFLKSRDLKNPFFLFISFIEPHHQNDHNCFEGPHGSKERFGNYEVPKDLEGTKGDWRENFPDYLGQCWSLDQNVGRLREELERRGILDNTLLIYTCDHGCHFRTRNAEYKRSCHESSIHLPLIVRGPGFRGGKVKSELVGLLDTPPTVLAAAGIEKPAQMVGTALQPLAAGTAGQWRDTVFVQISEDHTGRAIRTAKWKYEVWVPKVAGAGKAKAQGKAKGKKAKAQPQPQAQAQAQANALANPDINAAVYHEYHLYDLEADPYEKNELVADAAHAAVRAELAAKLKEMMAAAGERVPQILPA